MRRNKREKQKEKEQQHRMALATEHKKEILTSNQIHKTDTGSPEVQIALLSGRLTQLQQHFKLHKMDHASRKGLLTMVARRRRLITYLRKKDPQRYESTLLKLGIRH